MMASGFDMIKGIYQIRGACDDSVCANVVKCYSLLLDPK